MSKNIGSKWIGSRGKGKKKSSSKRTVRRTASRNSIVYNANRFEYSGTRFRFSQETLDFFRSSTSEGMDICHRVSYKLMADALVNAANFYLDYYQKSGEANIAGETKRQESEEADIARETTNYILGIICAVRGKMPTSMDFTDKTIDELILSKELEGYREDIKKLRELFAVDPRGTSDQNVEITERLNGILYKLNNEKNNLREGSSSWNSSIGSAFDCFGTVALMVYNQQGEEAFVLGEKDSEVLTLLLHMTKPGGKNYNESGLYIYTAESKNHEGILYQSTQSGRARTSEMSTLNCPIIYYNKYEGKFYNFDTGTPCQSEDLREEVWSFLQGMESVSAAETDEQIGTETGMPPAAAADTGRELIGYGGLLEGNDGARGVSKVNAPRAGKRVMEKDRNKSPAAARRLRTRKNVSENRRSGTAPRGGVGVGRLL